MVQLDCLFVRLFPLIPHKDSSKLGYGCGKTVLCCKKSMVGGRGLCSLGDAVVMGYLKSAQGHAAPVPVMAGLGDCLTAFFIWDHLR